MTKCFKQLVLSPLFLPFYFYPFQFILILLMFLYICKDGVEPKLFELFSFDVPTNSEDFLS